MEITNNFTSDALQARPESVSDYLNKLMSDGANSFKEAKNKRTGFAKLDKKTGGLYPGLYVIAAMPSLGKTTFALNVANNLAEAGEEVIFFSLVESEFELVSKSLARRTPKGNTYRARQRTGVSALSIRRGDLSERVLTVADEYEKSIGNRLSIIDDNRACNISFIGDTIRNHVMRTGTKPVVFIDYLQFLQLEQDKNGRTQTTKETIDNVITELKQLSLKQGLTIFVISAINRASYLAPIALESLKESGGIEFTADVIWGLQLYCMNEEVFGVKGKQGEKWERAERAMAANPRAIELVCLKDRYGASGYSCYFEYNPEFDLFTEFTEGWKKRPIELI